MTTHLTGRFMKSFLALSLFLFLFFAIQYSSWAGNTWNSDLKTKIKSATILTSSVGTSSASKALYSGAVSQTHLEYVANQLVVRYNDNISQTRAASIAASNGLEVVKTGAYINYNVVNIPAGKTMTDVQKSLQQDPNVKYVQPNYVYYASGYFPNDIFFNDTTYSYSENTGAVSGEGNPVVMLYTDFTGGSHYYYSYQPYSYPLFGMGLCDLTWTGYTGVWSVTQGSGVKVGVLDTGVMMTHEDLIGRIGAGYDFVNNSGIPNDDNGHGTHVAGIIAANGNNRIGVVGIAPKCTIIPIKVLASDGTGVVANIADGIVAAYQRYGAQILNMSFGRLVQPDIPDQLLLEAINKARHAGIHLVAAANAGDDTQGIDFSADTTYYRPWVFPAMLPGVISVGSWDYEYTKTAPYTPIKEAYSSYGNHWGTTAFYTQYIDTDVPEDILGVDLFAPGGNAVTNDDNLTIPIYSTWPYVGYTQSGESAKYHGMYGTSMAAAQVSGEIALLLTRGIQDRRNVFYALYSTSFNPNNHDYGEYTTDWGYGMIDPAHLILDYQAVTNVGYLGSYIDDTPNNDGVYGNGDGNLNPGETVDMYSIIQNNGLSFLYNVQGVLTTDDPNISIDPSRSTTYFGNLLLGTLAYNSTPFRYTLKPNIDVTNGYIAHFLLTLTYTKPQGGTGTLSLPISQDVIDPSVPIDSLVVQNYQIMDNPAMDTTQPIVGNSNGSLNPGETVELTVRLADPGANPDLNVFSILSSTDPNITVSLCSSYYGDITSGGSAVNSSVFLIHASANIDTSTLYTARLILFANYTTILGDNRYKFLNLEIPIGNGAPPDYHVALQSFTINDYPTDGRYGNNNGQLNPGETADIQFLLQNDSNFQLNNILGYVSTADQDVSFVQDTVIIVNQSTTNSNIIPINGFAVDTPSIYARIHVNPITISGYREVTCSLNLTIGNQVQMSLPFYIPIYPQVGGVYHSLHDEAINDEQYSVWDDVYKGTYRYGLIAGNDGNSYINRSCNLVPQLTNYTNNYLFQINSTVAPVNGTLYIYNDLMVAAYPNTNMMRDGFGYTNITGPNTGYWTLNPPPPSGYSYISTFAQASAGYTVFADTTWKGFAGGILPADGCFSFVNFETDLSLNGGLLSYTVPSGRDSTAFVALTTNHWLDRFPVSFAHETSLSLDHFEIWDSPSQPGNHLILPGKTVRMRPFVKNSSVLLPLSTISSVLSTNDPYVNITQSVVHSNGIRGTYLIGWSRRCIYEPIESGFEFTVSPDAPQNHKIYFTMTIYGGLDPSSWPLPGGITDPGLLASILATTTWHCPFEADMGELVVYTGATAAFPASARISQGNVNVGTYEEHASENQDFRSHWYVDRNAVDWNFGSAFYGPNPAWGVSWDDSTTPNTSIASITTGTYNNGDGKINPGERIRLSMSIWNCNFTDEKNGLSLKITCNDPDVKLTVDSTTSLFCLAPREIKRLNNIFEFYTPVTFSKTSILLKVTITDFYGNNYINELTLPVLFNYPPQVPGFPFKSTEPIKSSPTLVNLNKDPSGDPTILIGDESGKLFGLKLAIPKVTSSTTLGFYSVWTANAGAAIRNPVAAGDIDGSGQYSVVAVPVDGNLYAWHSTANGYGSNSSGLIYNFYGTNSVFLSAPVLTDLNQDGHLDILVGGSRTDGQVVSGVLFAFAYDSISSRFTTIGYYGTPSTQLLGPISVPPAVGRIHPTDPAPSVVAVSQMGEVAVYDSAGNRTMYQQIPGQVPINAPPVLGDINSDGDLEVIVKASDGNLYAWRQMDGALIPGFPIQTGGSLITPPILGDYNNDGKPEIIVGGTDSLVMINYYTNYNNAFYSIQTVTATGNYSNGQPALAQIDTTNYASLAFTLSDGAMRAVHPGVAFGIITSELYSTRTMWRFMNCSPAIGGFNDLYSTTYVYGQSTNNAVIVANDQGYVFAFMTLCETDPMLSYWPQYRNDSYHTGMYSQPTNDRSQEDIIGDSYVVNDDGRDPSSGRIGNNDGLLNSGETVDLNVTLMNIGLVGVQNVTGILSTADSNITISRNSTGFANINAGVQVSNVIGYRFSLAVLSSMTAYTAHFNLNLKYTTFRGPTTINLPVDIPVIYEPTQFAIQNYTILDDPTSGRIGNGNRRLNPNELVDLQIQLINNGLYPDYGVWGRISTNNPYVTIYQDSAKYFLDSNSVIYPVNSAVTNTPFYRFQLGNVLVSNYMEVTCFLSLTAGTQQDQSLITFMIPIYPKIGAVYHAVDLEETNDQDYSTWGNRYLGEYYTIIPGLNGASYLNNLATLDPRLINNTYYFFYNTGATSPINGTLYVYNDIPNTYNLGISPLAGTYDGGMVRLQGGTLPPVDNYTTGNANGMTYVGSQANPQFGAYQFIPETTYVNQGNNPIPADNVYGFVTFETDLRSTLGFMSSYFVSAPPEAATTQRWLDRFSVVYAHETSLALDHFEILDSHGNQAGNKIIEPGETLRIKPFIKNSSNMEIAGTISAVLSTGDPFVTIQASTVSFVIPPYPTRRSTYIPNQSGFEITVDPSAPQNHQLYFTMTIFGGLNPDSPLPYNVTDSSLRASILATTTWRCPFMLDMGQLIVYTGATSSNARGTYGYHASSDQRAVTWNYGNGKQGPNSEYMVSWDDSTDNNATVDSITTSTYNNGDGMVNPGESINLSLSLWNRNYVNEISGIYGVLTCADSRIMIVNGNVLVGNIGPREIRKLSNVFKFKVPINYSANSILFNLILTDFSGNQYVNEILIPVFRNYPPQIPGFPFKSEDPILCSPTVVDFDQDGINEIMVGNEAGQIFGIKMAIPQILSLSSTTSIVSFYSVWTAYAGVPIRNALAVGDIDGSHSNSVIAIGADGNLYAWSSTSQPYGNASSSLMVNNNGTSSKLLSAPALVDLKNNGGMEIVAGGSVSDGITTYGMVFAYDSQFKLVGNFGNYSTNHLNGPVVVPPAVGKILPTDLYASVVAASQKGEVVVYDNLGNVRVKMQISGNPPINSPPVIGDIDGDGFNEIVVKASDNNIYAWHVDGSPVTGFPLATEGSVNTPIALADMYGNDSVPEIIVGGNDALLIITYNSGSPTIQRISLTALGIGNFSNGQPAIANINGDSIKDIMFTLAQGNYVAYENTSPLYESMSTWRFMNQSPAAGRLVNAYGPVIKGQVTNNAVAVASDLGYVHAFLHLYDLLSPEWPQFRHDPQHTGMYSGNTVANYMERLTLSRYSINDDGRDPSSGLFGNANGILNPGETVDLTVILSNLGFDTISSLSATLQTSDANVNILQSNAYYGDIVPGTSVNNTSSPFRFSLSQSIDTSKPYTVAFNLVANYATYRGLTTVTLPLNIPVSFIQDTTASGYVNFSIISSIIIDNASDSRIGNGDGQLNPGETVDWKVLLKNTGNSSVSGVIGNFSSNCLQAVILRSSSSFYLPGTSNTTIPVGSLATDSIWFRFHLNSPTAYTMVTCTLQLIAGTQSTLTLTTVIPIYGAMGGVYHSIDLNVSQYNGLLVNGTDQYINPGETFTIKPTLLNNTPYLLFNWSGNPPVSGHIYVDRQVPGINLITSSPSDYYLTAFAGTAPFVGPQSAPQNGYILGVRPSIAGGATYNPDTSYGFAMVECDLRLNGLSTTITATSPVGDGTLASTTKRWLDRFAVTYCEQTALALDYVQIVNDPNNNNIIEPGETIRLKPYIKNASTLKVLGTSNPAVVAVLSSTDPYVSISVSSCTYNIGGFAKGTYAPNESGFEFTLLPGAPENHRIDFGLILNGSLDTTGMPSATSTFRDQLGGITAWNCPFFVDLGRLVLYDDSNGVPDYQIKYSDPVSVNTTVDSLTSGTFNNGNGQINPGERIKMGCSIWNRFYTQEIDGIKGTLNCLEPNVYLVSSTFELNTISPREIIQLPSTQFEFYLPLNYSKDSIRFELVMQDYTGITYRNTFTVPVQQGGTSNYPAEIPGYPFNSGAASKCSPKVADAYGDGIREVFFGNDAGDIYGVKIMMPQIITNGGVTTIQLPTAAGNIWHVTADAAISNSVAIGDIDGSNTQSIVAVGDNGQLYAWHYDMTPYGVNGKLPINLPSNMKLNTSPVLADINGDGAKEIIVGGQFSDITSTKGVVFAFDYRGNQIGQFGAGTAVVLQAPIVVPVAVADLVGDSNYEVVAAAQSGEVVILNGQGGLIRKLTTGSPINSPPVIGDVDNDGTKEIIVKSSNGNVHVWRSSTGAYLAGFPINVGGSALTPPIIADINMDRVPEIITGGTDSYVIISPFGTIVGTIPITAGYSNNQPVVADVDTTPSPEFIYTASDGSIHELAFDGTPIFNTPNMQFIYSSPAIVPFSNIYGINNGGQSSNNALVAISSSGILHAYLSPYDSDPGLAYWMQYRHDAENTGTYVPPPDNYLLSLPWYVNTVKNSTTGTSYVGTFDYSGDVDWLRFQGVVNHLYRITVTPVKGSTAIPQVSLYGPDGALLTGPDSAKVDYRVGINGTYFVAVSSQNGLFGPNTQYTVSINDLTLTTIKDWSLY